MISKKTIVISVFFFVLACIWLTGLLNYGSSIPSKVEDETTKTDAIIVLTGGSERLQTGINLLENKLAEKIFVSGVNERVKIETLLKTINPTDLKDKISLGYNARNTHENAIETAGWAEGQGIKSIRLVTSSYHMPRSMLEFEYAMPDTKIVPHPVFPEKFKRKQWWVWPGSSFLIASEYTKHMITFIRQNLSNSSENKNYMTKAEK